MPREFRRTERWLAEAQELWRPVRVTSGYTGKGFRFEVPWSAKHNVSVGFTYGLLLPFFLIGAVLIIRNRDKKNLFVLALLILYTFIHTVVAHSRNRYRVYMDAFIIIIAFYGLTYVYSLIKQRRKGVQAKP